MSALVALLGAGAVAAVAFVYIRFGKVAAGVAGALLALLAAYTKGRIEAAQDVERDLHEGELKDAKEIRERGTSARIRADRSAAKSDGELHDGFFRD